MPFFIFLIIFEISLLEQFGDEIKYCANHDLPSGNNETLHYCPWHKVYNQTDTSISSAVSTKKKKTLLILNQGAHFHSKQTFRDSFDRFIELFNTIANPGDIVVFRNTVPGHKDCFKGRNTTISNMTHDKFLDLYATNKYDWNLFDDYNKYAKETFEQGITNTVTSHYMNVYNMTVLRPDQHVAAGDCIHYTEPGPADFWNHLMITNLADLAAMQ